MEAEFALVQSYYFMAKIDRKGAYRVVTFAADCEFQIRFEGKVILKCH